MFAKCVRNLSPGPALALERLTAYAVNRSGWRSFFRYKPVMPDGGCSSRQRGQRDGQSRVIFCAYAGRSNCEPQRPHPTPSITLLLTPNWKENSLGRGLRSKEVHCEAKVSRTRTSLRGCAGVDCAMCQHSNIPSRARRHGDPDVFLLNRIFVGPALDWV